MCWIGDVNKFETAEKDIPIYKVMDAGEEHFLSYFRGALYKKDTLVTSEIEIGYKVVTKALHSYSIKNTKPEINKSISCGELVSDIHIISTINGRMVEDYGYTQSKLILGYIPKGSRFCENDFGEIVSDQLIMTKVCSEKELKELSK